MTDGKPMHIISLEAENVKRIKAVHIEPSGNLVLITGKNDQGKSSVLDSIWYCLGGKSVQPAEALRRGAKRGRVTLNLGELVAERIWTEGGDRLEVRNAEGVKQRSPQEILDRLVGDLAFDPMAFVQMKPDEQLATLKRLTGIDFQELDAKRAEIYAARTEVGRQLRAAQAQLDACPVVTAPDEPVSLAALFEEHKVALEEKAVNDRQRDALDAGDQSIAKAKAWREQWLQEQTTNLGDIDDRISRLKREIEQAAREREDATARLKAEGDRMQAEIDRQELEQNDLAAQIAMLEDPDTESIQRRISTCEQTNKLVAAKQQRNVLVARVEEVEARVNQMTADLEKIDADKAATVAAAKMPVEGLSFGEAGVLLDGLPFEQASTSKQLRASVAIGIAGAPRLRCMLVRRGESLDSDGLKLLNQIAEETDTQLMVEKVTDGQPMGIVIEDGMVREVVPAQ